MIPKQTDVSQESHWELNETIEYTIQLNSNQDFYHSKCCKSCFRTCNKRKTRKHTALIKLANAKHVYSDDNYENPSRIYLSKYPINDQCSQFWRSNKFWVAIVPFIVLYFLLAIFESLGLIDWDVGEILRAIIINLILFLVIFSFNAKLFLRQIGEFETIYKLWNSFIVAYAWIHIAFKCKGKENGGNGDNNILDLFGVIGFTSNIIFVVMFVSTIDAWKVESQCTKVIAICFGICGTSWFAVIGRTAFITDSECDSVDWSIFGLYDISVQATVNSAFANIILFLIKQVVSIAYFNYKSKKQDGLMNSIRRSISGKSVSQTSVIEKQRKHKIYAATITAHPIIEWSEPLYLNFQSHQKQYGKRKEIYNKEIPLLAKIDHDPL